MNISLLFLSTHMHIMDKWGWPRAEQLKFLGLSETFLADPRGRIAADCAAEFYEEASRRLDDPLLPLRIGNQFQPTSYDKWATFLNYSGSVFQAWDINARYQPLAETLGRCTVSEAENGRAYLVWEPYFPSSDDFHFRAITEIIFGGYIASIRWLLWSKKADILGVQFRHRAAFPVDVYNDRFDLNIHHGAPCNAVLIKAEDLHAHLPTSNPEKLAQVTERLDKLLMRQKNTSPLRQSLEAAMRTVLGSGSVSQSKVARQMNMSDAMLRRSLSEEKLSYRSILEDVRKRAFYHLHQDGHGLADIALMLGYSDQTAFSRAFRKWHGKSPSEFFDA